MTRQSVFGQCKICGKQGKQSFEHVPNKKAYNEAKVIEHSFEDVFVKKKNVKGKIVQGGIGEYTLCESCNSNTGAWYGIEYIHWAKTCFDFLRTRTPSPTEPDKAIVHLNNVHPLRFLKQVVVFFFSVAPDLARTYPELKHFVLDKQNTRLPQGCRFFLNLYFGEKPNLKRWPLAANISFRMEGGQIIPVYSSVLSEVAHPPFALTMSEETGFRGAREITSFIKYGYEELVNLKLKLRVIRGKSEFPGSFE
jgi:hypothetical protein